MLLFLALPLALLCLYLTAVCLRRRLLKQAAVLGIVSFMFLALVLAGTGIMVWLEHS